MPSYKIEDYLEAKEMGLDLAIFVENEEYYKLKMLKERSNEL